MVNRTLKSNEWYSVHMNRTLKSNEWYSVHMNRTLKSNERYSVHSYRITNTGKGQDRKNQMWVCTYKREYA